MKKSEKSSNKQAGFPSENSNGIGFLYKVVSVAHTGLSYWITVPEFVERIRHLQEQRVTIDERMVFDIMKEVYKQKLDDEQNGIDTDFLFYPARRCMIKIAINLTGNPENWDK